MSEKKPEKTWLHRQAESEAKKDVMPMSERWGSIAPVAGIAIVILFFALHQTWSTGFFTSGFGSAEAFLFYAPMVLFLLTMMARIVIGRKNIVRPFDAVALAVVAITVIWLYIVFPFDFTHLADVLPNSLRFVLKWISSDIAKIVMILMILGSSFFAAYTAILYVNVQRELSTPKKN